MSFRSIVATWFATWLTVLLGASAACSSCHARSTPTYPPGLPAGSDTCGAAEANLERLGCHTAQGHEAWHSPGGVRLPDGGLSPPIPYGDICRARLRDGRDLRPECIARPEFQCDRLGAVDALNPGDPCP